MSTALLLDSLVDHYMEGKSLTKQYFSDIFSALSMLSEVEIKLNNNFWKLGYIGGKKLQYENIWQYLNSYDTL